MNRRLATRLRKYWRLEAINIVALPVAVLVMVSAGGGTPNLVLAATFIANSVLLAIGACYWRIVLHKVEGDPAPFATWLPRLAAAERMALALTVLAVAVTCFDVWVGEGAWPPERIAAVAMATLAILEYVNYYRFQLQYFDHQPDFTALMKRKTLRRAHLARDIAEWRAGRCVKDI
jgi:hypothetical protein